MTSKCPPAKTIWKYVILGKSSAPTEGTDGDQKTGESSVPPPERNPTMAQLSCISFRPRKRRRSDLRFMPNRADDDEISAADASALLRKMSRPGPEETAPQATTGSCLPPTRRNGFRLLPIPARPQSARKLGRPEEAEKFIQSPPVRHPAYFRKNFIQLTGAYQPATGDEMVIGDRHYLLRPKKIKPQYIIVGFSAVILVAIVIIAAQFLSPTLPGVGNVVGVVLDEDGRPLKTGAQISLPEAGQRASVDGFGFFRFERVPTGTYVIRCQLPDGTLKTDNVSVVTDQVTTISLVLRPNSD